MFGRATAAGAVRTAAATRTRTARGAPPSRAARAGKRMRTFVSCSDLCRVLECLTPAAGAVQTASGAARRQRRAARGAPPSWATRAGKRPIASAFSCIASGGKPITNICQNCLKPQSNQFRFCQTNNKPNAHSDQTVSKLRPNRLGAPWDLNGRGASQLTLISFESFYALPIIERAGGRRDGGGATPTSSARKRWPDEHGADVNEYGQDFEFHRSAMSQGMKLKGRCVAVLY